jgi:hypothetical protein
MKYLFPSCAALAVAASVQAQGVITQWTFTGDVTTPSTGSGTASLIGGTTAGFAGGQTPAPDRRWSVSTFPAQGTGSGTAGASFAVSTVGLDPSISGISFTFDLRTSNTASRWYRVDYTTDGGTNWTLGTATRLGTDGLSAGDQWHVGNSVLVTDSTAFNNAQFAVRVVSVFSPVDFTQVNGNIAYGANAAYEVARNPTAGTTSAYATTGTWGFDNVTFTAIPAPGAIVLLGLAGALGGHRRRVT